MLTTIVWVIVALRPLLSTFSWDEYRGLFFLIGGLHAMVWLVLILPLSLMVDESSRLYLLRYSIPIGAIGGCLVVLLFGIAGVFLSFHSWKALNWRNISILLPGAAISGAFIAATMSFFRTLFRKDRHG
jgi:uncharacterized membrane protein YfcA